MRHARKRTRQKTAGSEAHTNVSTTKEKCTDPHCPALSRLLKPHVQNCTRYTRATLQTAQRASRIGSANANKRHSNAQDRQGIGPHAAPTFTPRPLDDAAPSNSTPSPLATSTMYRSPNNRSAACPAPAPAPACSIITSLQTCKLFLVPTVVQTTTTTHKSMHQLLPFRPRSLAPRLQANKSKHYARARSSDLWLVVPRPRTAFGGL